MTDLSALAERIEAAEGPSRDLDAEIAPILGLRIVEEGHPLGRCCYDANHRLGVLPSYTANVDAAMTIVPDGWGFAIGNGIPHEQPWAWCARPGEVDAIHAATPALALAAAALRARSQGGTDHG